MVPRHIRHEEASPGTAKRDVVCKISPGTLECGLRGQPPIVEGSLHAKVRVDDCMWQLQDSHKLIVTLQKLITDASVSVQFAQHTCLCGGSTPVFIADTLECLSLFLRAARGGRAY